MIHTPRTPNPPNVVSPRRDSMRARRRSSTGRTRTGDRDIRDGPTGGPQIIRRAAPDRTPPGRQVGSGAAGAGCWRWSPSSRRWRRWRSWAPSCYPRFAPAVSQEEWCAPPSTTSMPRCKTVTWPRCAASPAVRPGTATSATTRTHGRPPTRGSPRPSSTRWWPASTRWSSTATTPRPTSPLHGLRSGDPVHPKLRPAVPRQPVEDLPGVLLAQAADTAARAVQVVAGLDDALGHEASAFFR